MARFGDISVGKASAPVKPSWMEEDEEPASPAPAPAGDGDESLMAALEDYERARKAGDSIGQAKAFRAAFMACEASPHVEADEDEE